MNKKNEQMNHYDWFSFLKTKWIWLDEKKNRIKAVTSYHFSRCFATNFAPTDFLFVLFDTCRCVSLVVGLLLALFHQLALSHFLSLSLSRARAHSRSDLLPFVPAGGGREIDSLLFFPVRRRWRVESGENRMPSRPSEQREYWHCRSPMPTAEDDDDDDDDDDDGQRL